MLKTKVKKKIVQRLKDERLRRIRYELRTLLRLEKERRWFKLNDLFESSSLNFKVLNRNLFLIILFKEPLVELEFIDFFWSSETISEL